MCGIFGQWNLDGRPVDFDVLKSATRRLRHRGPDDEGFLLADFRKDRLTLVRGEETDQRVQNGEFAYHGEPYPIGFGFRRLSILDLSPAGHQPMADHRKKRWIIFNGEIFNFQELRQELRGVGYQFVSDSDTEVILAAYDHWGEKCLNLFNGMWAFAILDVEKKEILLSRDRFGVKPLFYSFDGDTFLFSSEIKGLVAEGLIPFKPDDEAIFQYLGYGALPGARSGQTFFENIHSLPPGSILKINLDGLHIEKYWQLKRTEEKSLALPESEEYYRSLLLDAIRLRLRSDVPIGTCLSGGVDSSAIACGINYLMEKEGLSNRQIGSQQRTFSAVYGESSPFDESRYVDIVLQRTGAQKNFTIPNYERLQQDIEELVWRQEEPYLTSSMFAQWCVMKMVRQSGVTVLLDGQGADECLGGYRPYHHLLSGLIRRGQFGSAVREALNISHNQAGNGWTYLLAAAGLSLPGPIPGLVMGRSVQTRSGVGYLGGEFVEAQKGNRPVLDRSNSLDEHLRLILEDTKLPQLLRLEDRNAMAFSVEARVPFLDYRLVEFSFNQASAWRMKKGWTKYILRKAMQPIVPAGILWRKDKIGFETPQRDWLQKWIKNGTPIFHTESKAGEYLNIRKIQSAISNPAETEKISHLLWRWINLDLWLKVWAR